MNAEWLPAVVTAGGRLDDALAAKAGTRLKALVPFGGRTLLSRVVSSLRESGRVQKIIVVGPKAELEAEAKHAGADEVVQEGGNGAQNMEIGLALLRTQANAERVLVAASDLPYITAMAVRGLLDTVKNDGSDILLPMTTKAALDGLCPGKPVTPIKLSDGLIVPSSFLVVRPLAVERSRQVIEKLYNTRNNPAGMAGALGFIPMIKFYLGMLSVAEAEGKLSQMTGYSCKTLKGADPRLCADFDTLQDFEYLVKSLQQT